MATETTKTEASEENQFRWACVRAGFWAFILFLLWSLAMCEINNRAAISLSEINKSAAESGLRVRWIYGDGTRTYEPVEEPKK